MTFALNFKCGTSVKDVGLKIVRTHLYYRLQRRHMYQNYLCFYAHIKCTLDDFHA